jgi:septal ring factor EnvC (AmiA/AmiB activator)
MTKKTNSELTKENEELRSRIVELQQENDNLKWKAVEMDGKIIRATEELAETKAERDQESGRVSAYEAALEMITGTVKDRSEERERVLERCMGR